MAADGNPGTPHSDHDLVAGLSDLFDLVGNGGPGLAVLQRIVDLAQAQAGASGALVVEFGRDTGRVVATSGALDWMLGRSIQMAHPLMLRLRERAGVTEFDRADLGPEAERQFAGHRLRRLLRAPVLAGGTSIGDLVVCYAEDVVSPPKAPGGGCSVLGLLARFAAHLYTLGRGLPVHEGGVNASSSLEAFATVDAAGQVLTWNAAAELLTAVSVEHAVGRPWPFQLPLDDSVIEHRMDCGRWIEIRSASITGSDTRAVAFRPRPDAESRDEDRDLFIAVTSHELRTPVTVIRGYADTLIEHWEYLDERARREAVTVIGQRSRELARVLDRLLSAAGDGLGPAGSSVALPFDLVEALRDAVADLTADLRRSLVLALPDALPKALGDRVSLATIVTELITNACKYSPERVDVELTAGADAQTVWFRVGDRGVGVRPEHVERAFERFWQIETGDQRRYGGVGLGLYLVRRIVEKQHGWVHLRPRDGGGTVAEVRLPRADIGLGEA